MKIFDVSDVGIGPSTVGVGTFSKAADAGEAATHSDNTDAQQTLSKQAMSRPRARGRIPRICIISSLVHRDGGGPCNRGYTNLSKPSPSCQALVSARSWRQGATAPALADDGRTGLQPRVAAQAGSMPGAYQDATNHSSNSSRSGRKSGRAAPSRASRASTRWTWTVPRCTL